MTKQTDTHTCLKHNSDQAQAVQYAPQTGHAINKISTYVRSGLKELTGSFEMEVRCRRSKTSPQNRQVHGGYSSPFRSRGKRWVCPLNLCFQNSHILETSQLLTNKGLPCLLMLETRKRGSQRFATKTPYSVTEWRSSKDLNLGPTMLNVNRRRGGTGKQEAATLQLTGELLELVLTQIQFANIDENPETQTRKRGETNRSKGEARNIVEQGCEGDSKWSVGRKFLGLIALALDLDEGFFENIGALNDPTAVVRLLRYPGGLLKDDVLGSMNAKRTNNLPRELRAYRFPPILAGDYIGYVLPDDFPGKSYGCRRLTWKSPGQCRDDASVTCSVWRMVVENGCWNFVADHFKGARMLFLSEGLTHADLVAMAQEDYNLDMNTESVELSYSLQQMAPDLPPIHVTSDRQVRNLLEITKTHEVRLTVDDLHGSLLVNAETYMEVVSNCYML
ncbi:hypothetical protein F2Q70_00039549 [Brassica cretica]|uniref:Uncharacterized protein n=1 Tax=Brassica cretica TaxID=69181 RepID=A0A8S9KAE4_BRACR|nr:hypothetical protein F2Q70_00039549 [Brassica cretica]